MDRMEYRDLTEPIEALEEEILSMWEQERTFEQSLAPVSYTHLTLPTILLV